MDKDNLNNEQEYKIEIMSISKKKRVKSNKVWLLQIFFISLFLSIIFALISELMLSNASLALALFLIIFLIVVSGIFDIVGMAVTACNIRPLLICKQKGERGADIGLKMVKNADKICCICSDVVGDICSILCGAGGVAITVILVAHFPTFNAIIMSILVSSVIASISVLGKAIGKTFALNNSLKVVLWTGKVLSIFKKSSRKSFK